LGGFLLNKDNYDKYVILSNKNISWSVDTQHSILYRKLKDDEIDKNINIEKEQTELFVKENGKLQEKYDKLEKAYYELIDKYTRLKEKYEKTKTNTAR
jgi:predicted nuclease with TOPRIM domain